jgi:acylphosphatase
MASERVRRRVVVYGRVQGVGFRYTVQQRASAAGVDGWVTNRGDGSVEAVLEGPAGAVDRVVGFMRSGPPGAEVTDVRVSNEEGPEGLSGFAVR